MTKISLRGQISELEFCINELKSDLGISVSDGGKVVNVAKRDAAGLSVSINGDEAFISYTTIPDFCRALCILINGIEKRNKKLCVNEDRELDKSGIMLDVSRNAVIRVETAKDLIRRIARMGLNTFMLYMENIYKLKDYPYFGYMRGAYTEEELKEINDYALKFGVEVVPCIQTLGHLSNALRWPYAKGIKDTKDILLIDEPKTYEFIEAMISTISRCFSSERIHVGMDEAFAVGTGAYKSKHGEVDKLELIGRHLSKVKDIMAKYNKTPIMWCDMIMRQYSPIGQYWDMNTEVTPERAKLVPKGYDLAYWDYYYEFEEMYDKMFECLGKISDKYSYYGGIWCWGGRSVDYEKTFRTTRPAMAACKRNNVREAYATLWGDDGAEVSPYTALLGMQLFAEYTYHADVKDEELAEMFRICTGYEMDSFMMLDLDNIAEAENYKNTAYPPTSAITVSKQILYQDALMGLLDKQYEHVNLKGHYKAILDKYANAVIPKDLKLLFDYSKQLTKVLYLKCDIGNRMVLNYKKHDRKLLTKNVGEVKVLIKEYKKLHELFCDMWIMNNKAFGLDRIDLRMGGAIERLNRTKQRLESYLKGEVSFLEELEEERLKIAEEEFVHCPFYNYFVSASMQLENRHW